MSYREISYIGEKSGKCKVCGKQAKRRETFMQTISPYNRNKQGGAKTVPEIHVELAAEYKEWKSAPVVHVKCQNKEQGQ